MFLENDGPLWRWRVTMPGDEWRQVDDGMTTGCLAPNPGLWHVTRSGLAPNPGLWHVVPSSHVVVVSSSCRRRAVVVPSSCRRRAVVLSSSCRRRVVVVSSSCRPHVVVTSSSGRRHVVACCPSRFWPFSSVYLLNYNKLRLNKW